MEKATETFPEWVPRDIVEFYEENGIKKLFKWQKELLNDQEAVGFDGNVVFSAPTSAGKSLVSELLAWRVAETGKKVLFVLPYISVARERLHQIQKCWRRVDISVSAFIGPSATNPKDWTGAVCTIEKAASLTNRALSEGWFGEVGMVVIDELHMIFDSSRGSHIEYMLSKIKFWNRSCTDSERIKVVGMSATIPQIEILGNWMDAKVYKADFRPIEIVENVIMGNYLMGIENGKFQTENKIKLEVEEKRDPVMILVEQSYRQNCQTLIMCSSKVETEKVATSIAQMMSELRQSDPSLIEILKKRSDGLIFTKTGLERNGCRDRSLMMSLSWAVAFHHAGLTLEERECIEMGFREKSVMILVATSTLASGVNLPAERVIIKSQTRGPSAISAMSYRQMIGRVGRMGLAEKGESYLVVRPSDEGNIEKIIFDSAHSLQLEHTRRQEGKKDLSKFILEGVCTSLTKHRSQVLDLSSSLLLSGVDNENETIVDSSLEKLKTNSFVVEVPVEENETEISPTQLGKATIASSLPPDAALAIFEDLNIASRAIALDTELHMLYLVTPINVTVWQECDWHHLFSIFSKIPPDHRRVAKLVGANERFLLNQMRGCKDDVKLQTHIRFFSALALFDLINEHPIHEVSQKYRISRGCLQTLQSQSSTYAAMVVAFCLRLGWTYLKSLLDGFAMRLFFGIRSELSDLVSIDGIDGQRARIFHEKGITCLTQLTSCDKDKLAYYLTLAVPYSRLNSNDGKGEWLFGEPRIKLDEAARILKERAKQVLMNRIKELGLDVTVRMKQEEDVVESRVEIKKEIKVENETGKEIEMENIKTEEDFDAMTEDITQNLTEIFSMECSIVSDNSASNDDSDVFLENDDAKSRVFENLKEETEEDQIDCLETSLLKMVAPNEERFLRRLSQTFSPVFKFKSHPKPEFDDSFDCPVPGSVPLTVSKNKSRRESIIADEFREKECRRDSLDASTASENRSFDVFATPPPKDEKMGQLVKDKALKHSRITYMTNSPLSSFVSSPILKHVKFDENRFFLDDICSNFENWNEWIKLAKTSSNISMTVGKHFEGIAISTCRTNTVYIPMEEDNEKENSLKCSIPFQNRIETIKLLFESKETDVIIHSLIVCFKLFEKFGIRIANPNPISTLAHLNFLVKLENVETEEEWFPQLFDMVQWDFDIKTMYSNRQSDGSEENKLALESFVMRRVFDNLTLSAVEKSKKESVELELEAVKAVVRIFYSGIPFDRLECDSSVNQLRMKLDSLEEECFRLAHGKFNIDSSKHVANVLFVRLGLIYPDGTSSNTKKHLETSKKVLEQMVGQHEIVEKVLKYRHVKHTLTQCLIPIQLIHSNRTRNDGRIHCWFEMETTTGRILTSSPNIQSVPKRESLDGLCVRQIIRSKESYCLIGADYSQLELRVLAHLSNDRKLVEMIVQERDIFQDLSETWNFPRDAVKQLCYGMIYGMGARSLAELTKLTVKEAENLLKMFFEMFPRVKSYICETKEKAFEDGFVETILGRKRITNRNQLAEERSREERVVVNYTIQGSASEIFKNAIVQIERDLEGLDARIVMIIHDEVVVETADDVAKQAGEIIRVAMESSLRNILRVPMRVSMKKAKTWAGLK